MYRGLTPHKFTPMTGVHKRIIRTSTARLRRSVVAAYAKRYAIKLNCMKQSNVKQIIWIVLICICSGIGVGACNEQNRTKPVDTCFDAKLELEKIPDSEAEKEKVILRSLECSEKIDGFSLLMTSSLAISAERTVDAAFLYYISTIRSQVDFRIFPPESGGGVGPAFRALHHQIGESIKSEIMKDAAKFSKVVSRIEKWTPYFSKEYSPGWKYLETGTVATYPKKILKTKDSLVSALQETETLFGNPEYFTAFRIVSEAYFGNHDWKREPTEHKIRREEAELTLKRIENKLKIQGPLSAYLEEMEKIRKIGN